MNIHRILANCSFQTVYFGKFITPFGRYCVNCIPFCITSAPEHFQHCMSEILVRLEKVSRTNHWWEWHSFRSRQSGSGIGHGNPNQYYRNSQISGNGEPAKLILPPPCLWHYAVKRVAELKESVDMGPNTARLVWDNHGKTKFHTNIGNVQCNT